MTPKIIKTENAYQAALAHVGSLMDAEPGSAEEEELEIWALLVEQFEKHQYPIEHPDPIEAIKFRMEQMGLRQKDLVKFIPAKSKVSEVLNRKRPLSLSMIRQLHRHLGISADILVSEPKLIKRENSQGKTVEPRSTGKKKAATRPPPKIKAEA